MPRVLSTGDCSLCYMGRMDVNLVGGGTKYCLGTTSPVATGDGSDSREREEQSPLGSMRHLRQDVSKCGNTVYMGRIMISRPGDWQTGSNLTYFATGIPR